MKSNPKTPSQYFASIPEPRKTEILILHKLIQKTVPKLKPFLLQTTGEPIVGYGKFAYKSKSGCEGDWFSLGLCNRKNYIALYVVAMKNGKYIVELSAKKFPKCKTGKSCINIKKLDDIDLSEVKKIVKEAEKLRPSLMTAWC